MVEGQQTSGLCGVWRGGDTALTACQTRDSDSLTVLQLCCPACPDIQTKLCEGQQGPVLPPGTEAVADPGTTQSERRIIDIVTRTRENVAVAAPAGRPPIRGRAGVT